MNQTMTSVLHDGEEWLNAPCSVITQKPASQKTTRGYATRRTPTTATSTHRYSFSRGFLNVWRSLLHGQKCLPTCGVSVMWIHPLIDCLPRLPCFFCRFASRFVVSEDSRYYSFVFRFPLLFLLLFYSITFFRLTAFLTFLV